MSDVGRACESDDRPGGREVRSLTGIRGLAACYVAFYHLHDNDAAPYGWIRLLHHGYLSVDVFFVLSGFVMAMSYGRMFASGITPAGYLAFLLRRLARIYPLYILVLCITALAAFFVHQHGAGTSGFGRLFVLNALMVQGWGLGGSIVGPAWSVSTEFAAYFVFPFLLAIVVHGKVPIWLSATACLGLVVAAALQPTPATITFPRRGALDVYWSASLWPVIRCIAEFSLGLLAFRCADQKWPVLRSTMFVWAVSLSAVLLLFVPGSDVPFVAMTPLLMIALLVDDHPVNRFLGSRPVVQLGYWSYAIYLWHEFLFGVSYRVEALTIRSMPHLAAAFVGEVAFWAVLLTVAAVSFRHVEVPGRRFVRKLEAQLFPREEKLIMTSEASGSQVTLVRR